MTSVERIKKICHLRKIPISKLEKDCGFSNGYISQLKKGYLPDDRLVSVANYLKVSCDFLIGCTESVPCPECGLFYMLGDEKDELRHIQRHELWLNANKVFGFCWAYMKREDIKAEARNRIRSNNLSDEEYINAQIDVFKALFSRSLEASDYDTKHVSFSDYVAMLLFQNTWKKQLPKNIYSALTTKYGSMPGLPNGTYFIIPGVDNQKNQQNELDVLSTSSNDDTFTIEEIARDYHKLDTFGKNVVNAVIAEELKRIQSTHESERHSNIIPLRRSRQPVSAGTGAYLGPEEFDTVFVEKNDLTERAAFAVPVRGDSMEPHFHDGDVLLVEGREDISVGEIGIFTVNGEGYVKERGTDVLISLNPQYEPVQMTEDSWCNGKVIGILDPEWVK